MKIKSDYLLKLFLGLVFLCAGVYRIFFWQSAISEIQALNIGFPAIISALVIILEISGGLAIIFNFHTKKFLWVFAAFLTSALLWMLILSWKTLLFNAGVLFTFRKWSTQRLCAIRIAQGRNLPSSV